MICGACDSWGFCSDLASVISQSLRFNWQSLTFPLKFEVRLSFFSPLESLLFIPVWHFYWKFLDVQSKSLKVLKLFYYFSFAWKNFVLTSVSQMKNFENQWNFEKNFVKFVQFQRLPGPWRFERKFGVRKLYRRRRRVFGPINFGSRPYVPTSDRQMDVQHQCPIWSWRSPWHFNFNCHGDFGSAGRQNFYQFFCQTATIDQNCGMDANYWPIRRDFV